MRYLVTLTIALILFYACSKDSEETALTYSKTEVLTEITNDIILGHHSSFRSSAESFYNDVIVFEQNINSNTLEMIQESWISLSVAYRSCELFDMGEAADTYLHRSFTAYPINKNFIENYIQDSIDLDSSFFDLAGSNTIGLFSIQYLLFSENQNSQEIIDSFNLSSNSKRRLEYLVGLAENITTKSEKLNLFWNNTGDNYASRFATNDSEGVDGAMNILVNALSNLTERIVVKKIGDPLGKNSGTFVDPTSFRQYSSKTTLQNINANFQAIKLTLEGSQGGKGIIYALEKLDAKSGDISLSSKVSLQLNKIDQILSSISQPIEDELITSQNTVENLYDEMKNLLVLLKVDVSSALSITVTISDSDGD